MGEFLNRMAQVRAKVLSSLTYPAFVILFSLLSVFAVVKFVIPKVAGVLAGLGKDLPLITKILLFFSKLMGYFLYLLPLFILLFVFRGRLISRENIDSTTLSFQSLARFPFTFSFQGLRAVCGCPCSLAFLSLGRCLWQ